jgi:hypothetical protein
MSLSTWVSRGWLSRGAALGLALVALLAMPARSARAVDPKYLPAGAEMVFSINLKTMLESDLAKAHKDGVAKLKQKILEKLGESHAKEYFDKAGFDLFHDLHSVTVTGGGGKDTDKLFLVLEGDFDSDKILDIARGIDDVKVGNVGKTPTLEITPKGDEKTIYAALLNDHVILAAGTRSLLTEGIARANSPKVTMKTSLKTLLDTTKATQSMNLVLTADGISNLMNDSPAPLPDNVNQQVQALDGISLNLTVAKDVSFQLVANVKDNDNASKLTKMLNFGLLAVRGMIGGKAENDEKYQLLLDVANTLAVAQQGQNVTLRGEISRENFDRILELIPKNE